MSPSKRIPSILFEPENQWFDDLPENLPMVITAIVGAGLVKRILVDTGADSNIMFRNVFDALGLRDTDLKTHQHGVVGLGDNFIKPDGVVSLLVSIGGRQGKRSVMAEFVVLRDSTAYNIILRRKTINKFGAVISTKLLMMKFVANDGSVTSIREIWKRRPRPEPEGDLEKFKISDSESDFTFMNKNLPHDLKEPLVDMIRANGDLFAWTPADMPGIDPQIMSHHLGVMTKAKPVAQRRRKMSKERAEKVPVMKPNGRWRMCVDYSDLNKVCPKDSFPLSNIDALVDTAAGYRGNVLLQGDAVWIENAGATNPRLMKKIFKDLIGKTVEVYVDDILVKTTKAEDLISNLETVFASLR
ncbi:uncharacterized protein [Arachis hypogaea]|uniref:uncharacterized protein n=1 Tax=Arachis hypogaea TaxID=3818 RepID=UPI003B211948